MKSQSDRNILAPLSRRKRTSVLPLVVYGWFSLIMLLALILYYVSVNYGTGTDLNGHQTSRGVTQGLRREHLAEDSQKKETLILSTKGHGDIHIVLRPDLSSESVAYIREMAKLPSPTCNLYRADQRILQGIIKSPNVEKVQKKGTCPPEYRGKKQPACPPWDPDCGCHGPTMTKGMVGWAGGGTGQDFFIETYEKPAEWWGQQHTVWGEVQDEKSYAVIDAIFKLPTHNEGGMVFLNEKITFEMRIM